MKRLRPSSPIRCSARFPPRAAGVLSAGFIPRGLFLLAPYLVSACSATAWAKPAEAEAIRALETWSGVFGGRVEKFHFSVDVPRATSGTMAWEFRSGEQRISQRQFPVETRPGKSTEFEVALEIPPIQRNLLVESELVLRYDATNPALVLKKPVRIFPDDPFVDRREWLRDLKISLFDPLGRTEEVFQVAKIPFVQVRNLESLAGAREGMVIVGEGVSFRDFPAVRFAMVEAARHGVPVLCLAPAVGGEFPVPGAENSNGVFPAELQFRRQEIIKNLDRRLDWRAWPPDGKVMACGIRLKADRNQVVSAFAEDSEGWAWLEVNYPVPRGKLIVCSFAVIERWNHGPSPRYLFRGMLEKLSGSDNSPKSVSER
ncbi:MAG: hypothetical protein U1D30_19810 [Planctomycetota bacterium]